MKTPIYNDEASAEIDQKLSGITDKAKTEIVKPTISKPFKVRVNFKVANKKQDSQKSKIFKYNIDGTAISPTNVVLSSGKNFSKLYMAQLETILLHPSDTGDVRNIMQLVLLKSFFNKGGEVVYVTSARIHHSLPKVVEELNAFFKKHGDLIDSISGMFGEAKKIVPNYEDAPSA